MSSDFVMTWVCPSLNFHTECHLGKSATGSWKQHDIGVEMRHSKVIQLLYKTVNGNETTTTLRTISFRAWCGMNITVFLTIVLA